MHGDHVPSEPLFFGPPGLRRLAIAAAALLLAAFAPTFVEMVVTWIDYPEYSHGFLMPPVAAWIVRRRRGALAALRRDESSGGAGGALLAALALVPVSVLFFLGHTDLSWFLKPYAFLACLALGIRAFYGRAALRALLAPLVVLFLMCPLPGRVVNAITFPLKKAASRLATGMLDAAGLDVTLDGNMIYCPGTDGLWVADPCSGIRSLISLASVAVLACLFWRRSWVAKALVLAATVPIAVVVNGARIAVTGYLASKVGKGAAEGFFHLFEGLLLFGVAALLLAAFAAALGRLFPERAPRPAPAPLLGRPVSVPRLAPAAYLAGVVLLAGVGYAGARLAHAEVEPGAVERYQRALDRVPLEFPGPFVGQANELDPSVVGDSGADAWVSRTYRDAAGRRVDLYVGAAVRNRENLHAPSYCMPAQGWEIREQGSVALPESAFAPGARARRLVLQRGEALMLVHYWFQMGGRFTDHDLMARWFRVQDLLGGRPAEPVAIVTLYVPAAGRDLEAAESSAGAFLAAAGPAIRDAIRGGDGDHDAR